MKLLFGCIVCFLISACALTAQTSPEHVEKIERLSRDIETLISANAELQRKLSAVTDELNRVRQEQSAKSGTDTAVQAVREDLRKLAEKVQEVDRKRISDKEAIAKEVERSFDKLENLLKQNAGAGSRGNTVSAPPKPPKPIPSDGFEYVVKPGDRLEVIRNEANVQLKEQGLKTVTLQQVLDANPGLVPERMKPGQRIFIPAYK